MPIALLTGSTEASETVLNTIITGEMAGGVLNEVLALLPILIPVMIGFIGIRKGIAFFQGVLHRA